MLKRTLYLVIAFVVALAFLPAVNVTLDGGSVTLVGAGELEARRIKLNYYRTPGGEPWCEDACDDIACCTTPGQE